MRPRPKPEAEASPAPKRKPRVRRTVFHGERPTPDAVFAELVALRAGVVDDPAEREHDRGLRALHFARAYRRAHEQGTRAAENAALAALYEIGESNE
jgi:hypothetical protein